MEIYLYAGIIAKLVQNSEENGQGRQVDVAERPGAHMPRRLAPWCRPVCQVAWPCHRSVGATPQALSSVDPMSVCTDGHNGVVLDPWVHCHGLGALQPTPNHFTCKISTCADFTIAFGSQPGPYNRKVVKSRAGRRHYHAARRPTFSKPPQFGTTCTLAQV